ncbi:MAG: LapA family protein [Actinobacteria bacterium]|nr:LapA family protein [Actinomycetota bacterium]
MEEFASQAPRPADEGAQHPPRRWVPPLVFGLVVLIPSLVLIFSNTETTGISFAWYHGTAPRWIVLAVTFLAGAVVTRLLAWAWRAMRRRQKAQAGE